MSRYLRVLNLVIALITLVTGLAQMISPALELKLIGVEITETSKHLFATIGMFMFLFGGLLIHAIYSIQTNRVAILWGSLQKLGASIAVFIGIYHHLFSDLASIVAVFDFISAILLFWHYKKVGSLTL